MAGNYTVVFDSTHTNLWWWVTWTPAIFLVLLSVLVVLHYLWRFRRESLGQKALLFTVLLLFCLYGVLTIGSRYYITRHFYSSYGSYSTVEGFVRNYKVFRTANSVGEKFEVNGISFGYIDSFQWKCFHKAAANGGPLREGLAVRISYLPSNLPACIVKLEVAQDRP